MNNYFTIEEATDIAEDFSDLEDTSLIIEVDGDAISCHIQRVVVSPYPEAEKELFVRSYKKNGDFSAALAAYTGSEFDVLIVATDNNDSKRLITLRIKEYTDIYGIRYRYP